MACSSFFKQTSKAHFAYLFDNVTKMCRSIKSSWGKFASFNFFLSISSNTRTVLTSRCEFPEREDPPPPPPPPRPKATTPPPLGKRGGGLGVHAGDSLLLWDALLQGGPGGGEEGLAHRDGLDAGSRHAGQGRPGYGGIEDGETSATTYLICKQICACFEISCLKIRTNFVQ